MKTVTLQGPVVVLPEQEYRDLLNRVARLEKVVGRLLQLIENQNDIRVMHEAEVEYQAGDRVGFDDLIAEIEAESDGLSN